MLEKEERLVSPEEIFRDILAAAALCYISMVRPGTSIFWVDLLLLFDLT